MKKKKVFVGYNTDSVVAGLNDHYPKMFTYSESPHPSSDETANILSKNEQKCKIHQTSLEEEERRYHTFLSIRKWYQDKKGKYDLYFDILEAGYSNSDLYYHIQKNEDIIKDTDTIMFVFVVSEKEISFWQLQEAYFASYYDKKVLYLTTRSFLRAIKRRKLDKMIDAQLKIK